MFLGRDANTLSDVFISHKDNEEKGITFIKGLNDTDFVPYSTLVEKSLNLLGWFNSVGLHSGDYIIIFADDPQIFITIFWACISGGIVPVPTSYGFNEETIGKLKKIYKKLPGAKIITSDKSRMEKMIKSKVSDLMKDDFYNMMDSVLEYKGKNLSVKIACPVNRLPQDTAFIQFSSGSTGEPKGVVLSHLNLCTNINSIINGMQLHENDLPFSWMPLTHDMGLIGFHITPLVFNINQIIMPTSLFIRNSSIWMDIASLHKTTILSSPNFGYSYFVKNLNKDQKRNWDLSNVRLIFNGAEPISYKVIEEFTEAMECYGIKKKVMFPVYGLAEASLAVSFPKLNEGIKLHKISRTCLSFGSKIVESEDNFIPMVEVGSAVEHVKIRISDSEGKKFEDGVIGEIQIKGRNVTKGYIDDSKANKGLFTADEWLRTGDMGFLKEGNLVVTGRTKDMMSVGGQNIFFYDIDRILEEDSIVEFGKAFACCAFCSETGNEELFVVIHYKKKLNEFLHIKRAIVSHIRKKVGVNVYDVVPIKKIPKTTSGKVRRKILSEIVSSESTLEIRQNIRSLEASYYKEISNENLRENRNLSFLIDIVEDITGIKNFDISDNLLDLGIESYMLIEISKRIEDKFPGAITTSDFFKYPSVLELSKFLQREETLEFKGIKVDESIRLNLLSKNDKAFYRALIPKNTNEKLYDMEQIYNLKCFDILSGLFVFSLFRAFKHHELNVLLLTDKKWLHIVCFDFAKKNQDENFFTFVKKSINSGQRIRADMLRGIKKTDSKNISIVICDRESEVDLSKMQIHYDWILELDLSQQNSIVMLSDGECSELYQKKNVFNGFLNLIMIYSNKLKEKNQEEVI